MLDTMEATIDEKGAIRLLEPIQLSASRRALVTILDEEDEVHLHALALLSAPSLAEDWDRPEEDEEWAYLQPAR